MRFEDLSPADQKLLNTDLGEFEKEAAANVAVADEMYAVGFNKLAQQAADDIEASYAAEAEKVAADLSMDEESEKTAADLSAFIERGFFDGLRKLGSERYDDEMAYIVPFMEEKIAAEGAAIALAKFGGEAGFMGKAWQGFKGYHKGIHANLDKALTKGVGAKERAAEVGKAALKSVPHAAVAATGATAFGMHRAKKKKEKEAQGSEG